MSKVVVGLFGLVVVSFALGAAPGQAEIVVFTANLLAQNEVPPIMNADAAGVGLAVLTLDVTRSPDNTITGATARFDVGLSRFPSTAQVIGLHLQEAAAGVNGTIRIDSGISPASSVLLPPSGETVIMRANRPVSTPDVPFFLANPGGFYINVETTLNPGGASRGQLVTSTAFPSVALAVFPSATSFVPGDPIQLKLFLANVGTAVVADVFAGVGLPADQSAALCGAGDTALLFLGLTGGTSLECASRLAGPGSRVTFLVEDVTIPALPLTIFTLFGGQVPLGAGAGVYLGFAGVAAQNTFPNGPTKVDTDTFMIVH